MSNCHASSSPIPLCGYRNHAWDAGDKPSITLVSSWICWLKLWDTGTPTFCLWSLRPFKAQGLQG